MNNKKLIIIFVVVIIVIIILFGIIMRILEGRRIIPSSSYNYKEDVEYEKKVEEVESGKITGKYETNEKTTAYYNLDQNDRNELDKRIDYIVDMINSKRIDEIFGLFTRGYRLARFPTKELLSSYLDDELKENDKYIVDTFKVSDNRLYINVKLESDETVRRTILYKSYNNSSGDKVENLFFGKYLSANPISSYYANNQFRMMTSYTITYENSYSYVVRIDNISDEEMTINFKDSKLVATDGLNPERKELVSKEEFVIPAHSTKQIELEFEKTKLSPSYIELRGTVNDNNFSTNYYFKTSEHLGVL